MWVRPEPCLSAHRTTAWNELAANRYSGVVRARAHSAAGPAAELGRHPFSHFALQGKRTRLSFGSLFGLLDVATGTTSSTGGSGGSGAGAGGTGAGGGAGGVGGPGGSGAGAGGAVAEAYAFRIVLRHSNGRVC
jgi:hypothetical protein